MLLLRNNLGILYIKLSSLSYLFSYLLYFFVNFNIELLF